MQRATSPPLTSSSPSSLRSSRVINSYSYFQDDAYFERRRRNNDAAKRSRDARRMKEEAIAERAAKLEQENGQLRGQVSTRSQLMHEQTVRKCMAHTLGTASCHSLPLILFSRPSLAGKPCRGSSSFCCSYQRGCSSAVGVGTGCHLHCESRFLVRIPPRSTKPFTPPGSMLWYQPCLEGRHNCLSTSHPRSFCRPQDTHSLSCLYDIVYNIRMHAASD
ncbi:unnamed protein product [Heligmosomoides polygyrus]|uniref:BZIP domain-containing protein n=1 Tax=Heligmosomoides polygyrus TaxID=6339 RepID=A0A3P7ZC00_HELPZ|nr:unnamed protein product [Heligmosomoides polygyrus]